MINANTTVSDEIIAVLDDLSERMGIAIDWTEENVMPQVMEAIDGLIMYNIIINAIWCILPLLPISLLLFSVKKYIKTDSYDQEKQESMCVAAIIITGCLSFFTLIGALFSISDLIGWITMPEIKVIEYISQLVTGGN